MEKRSVQCPKCQQVMHILSLPEDREIGCIKCKKILKVPGVKKGTMETVGWRIRLPEGKIAGPFSEAAITQFVAKKQIVATYELNHPQLTGSTWRQAKDLPQFHGLFLPLESISELPPRTRRSKTQKALHVIDNLSGYVNRLIDTAKTWSRPQIVTYSIVGFALIVFTIATLGSIVTFAEEKRYQKPFTTEILRFTTVTVIGTVALTIGAVFYAAPTIIAFLRYHKNVIPIFIVDVCFGWTFIGWVLSLAWSFSADGPAIAPTHIHTHVYAREGQQENG